MSNYINLPGVNMELMDGNLRVDDSIQGNAVLIVGRAVSVNSSFLKGITILSTLDLILSWLRIPFMTRSNSLLPLNGLPRL
jgi:hypothetical protein